MVTLRTSESYLHELQASMESTLPPKHKGRRKSNGNTCSIKREEMKNNYLSVVNVLVCDLHGREEEVQDKKKLQKEAAKCVVLAAFGRKHLENKIEKGI